MLLINSISLFGIIPFCFNTYSNTNSGIPPILPPITDFPLISDHLKLGSGSRETMKLPARCVSCANAKG